MFVRNQRNPWPFEKNEQNFSMFERNEQNPWMFEKNEQISSMFDISCLQLNFLE